MTNISPPPPPPGRARSLWAKFRSWPRSAQVAVWVLVGFIGLGAIGSATEKKPATVPVRTTGTTATTVAEARTSSAPTSTAPQAPSTTTTAKPATTSTAGSATTTTTTKPTTTTTAKPVTTTTTVTPTTRAPVTTSTTVAPTTTSTTAGYVHAGAFCSPDGATGYTSGGTYMVCKTTPTDDRDRWRAG